MKLKKDEIVCYNKQKVKVLATRNDPYYDFAQPSGIKAKYPDDNKDYLIGILDANGITWSKKPVSCNENELQPWSED